MSNYMRTCLIILLLLGGSALWADDVRQDSTILAGLETMVAEDQTLRGIDTLDYSVIHAADMQHRQAVFVMLADNEIVSARAKYLAALLLQHADPSTCAECYLLAHQLSLSALNMGYEPARVLAATNLDRYLVFTGQPQKYGTQSNIDSTGQWYLYPVDSSVSDTERRKWGIQPLDSLKAEIDGLNSEKGPK